ncbi:MAG: transposase, partial [Deltaproteobacteria bacterium]|nr:transposase [Deltaproteobacteria bacterium]
MLQLPRAVRILLAAERVDLRFGIDGLSAIVRNVWRENLYAGHLFVFVSRLLDVIRLEEHVQADEAPQRVLEKGKTRKGYVWTFRAGKLVAYVHAQGRSGETAVSALGGARCWLQVDGYTGYNAVTVPEGRVRVGCWAPVRRKFVDALPTAPEAQAALDAILAQYRVEADAEAAGTLGTEAHLQQRQTVSAAVVQRM